MAVTRAHFKPARIVGGEQRDVAVIRVLARANLAGLETIRTRRIVQQAKCGERLIELVVEKVLGHTKVMRERAMQLHAELMTGVEIRERRVAKIGK